MTEAGLRKIEEAKKDGSWKNLDAVEKLTVPPDLLKALLANSAANKNFTALSPSRKKAFLYWINSAKTEITRTKRIVETVLRVAENRMLGT